MNAHFDTGPFPVAVQTVIDYQPPTTPRRWQRAARTFAHCLGVALVIVLFCALAAGPALLMGR